MDGDYKTCASCRNSNSPCPDDCLLAPFFPAHQAQNFENAHNVFGRTKVEELIQSIPDSSVRTIAMKNLIAEANIRAANPVNGVNGQLKVLQVQLENQARTISSLNQRIAQLLEQGNQNLGGPSTSRGGFNQGQGHRNLGGPIRNLGGPIRNLGGHIRNLTAYNQGQGSHQINLGGPINNAAGQGQGNFAQGNQGFAIPPAPPMNQGLVHQHQGSFARDSQGFAIPPAPGPINQQGQGNIGQGHIRRHAYRQHPYPGQSSMNRFQ